jgi:hypothetical protein
MPRRLHMKDNATETKPDQAELLLQRKIKNFPWLWAIRQMWIFPMDNAEVEVRNLPKHQKSLIWLLDRECLRHCDQVEIWIYQHGLTEEGRQNRQHVRKVEVGFRQSARNAILNNSYVADSGESEPIHAIVFSTPESPRLKLYPFKIPLTENGLRNLYDTSAQTES